MRDSKRMRRMERTSKKSQITGLGLNLIPMMDVLTVLVFFLLFHSFNGDMPAAKITLPDSVVETRPRETVHVVVTPEAVLVQDEERFERLLEGVLSFDLGRDPARAPENALARRRAKELLQRKARLF